MSSSPTEPPSVTAATRELSESERYQLLSDDRRRATLDVLANRSTPASLDTVARAVASREQDASIPDETVVERVEISLHHHHLPKMADLGVIDYDTMSQRVLCA